MTVMPEHNLKDFERCILTRPMRIEDYEAVAAMQLKCFPEMKPWKKEQIESQLTKFPEGQIVVEFEGIIVASSNSLILNFDDYSDDNDWRKIADSGYIRNHDPKGDRLYGIEIMVDPDYRGLKLARRLYDARKKVVVERNLKGIVIGGRIPGYAQYADQMTAEEYVERVTQKILVDPVLTVQLANGFVLKKLVPDYLTTDKESLGYATLLEWSNLDFVPKTDNHNSKDNARICIAQMKLREVKSFEEFAAHCEFFVDTASDYKSDFLVFPESFTSQLLGIFDAPRPALAVRKLSEYTDRFLKMMIGLAIKYNINIVGGSHFTLENEKLFNVSYLFRRDGTIGKQVKMQADPDEVRWWGLNAGNSVEVFDTDCGRVAILIGSDIEFPEATRVAVENGAGIIFVPFAAEERYAFLRIKHCAQARANENHVYVVTSGLVGIMPRSRQFEIRYAQSGIYTPPHISYMGSGMAIESDPNVETVMFEELDLAMLRKGRNSEIAVKRANRRRELFPI